jgi:predicted HicB family RNase H-like nuclease
MKYKGYTGLVELEEGSDVLFGRVIGLRDVITFQGESVAEVTQAFHDSVDDYLEFCETRGENPEKPYSGQFVLRLPPLLHRELANLAQAQCTSLNALIEDLLQKKVDHGAEQREPVPAKPSPAKSTPAKSTPAKPSPAKGRRPAPSAIGRASVDLERAEQLRAEENRFIRKQAQAIIEGMKAQGLMAVKKNSPR